MKFNNCNILLALSAMSFAISLTETYSVSNSPSVLPTMRWVKIEEANKDKLILAGKEYHGGGIGNNDLYVGRIYNNDSIIPGKYAPDNETDTFFYTDVNLQVGSARDNFEVLEYFPGTLSWISASGTSSGEDLEAIVAGNFAFMTESLYVCRGMVDGNLVVGMYLHDSRSCIVQFAGKNFLYEFEILTLNSLGKLLIEKEGEDSKSIITTETLIFNPKTNGIICPENESRSRSSVNIYNSQVSFY